MDSSGTQSSFQSGGCDVNEPADKNCRKGPASRVKPKRKSHRLVFWEHAPSLLLAGIYQKPSTHGGSRTSSKPDQAPLKAPDAGTIRIGCDGVTFRAAKNLQDASRRVKAQSERCILGEARSKSLNEA